MGLKVILFFQMALIHPAYINGVKRRILDVLHQPLFNDDCRYYSNSIVQFHIFSVEKLINISFYIDGPILNLKSPIVIHLKCNDNSYRLILYHVMQLFVQKGWPLNSSLIDVLFTMQILHKYTRVTVSRTRIDCNIL